MTKLFSAFFLIIKGFRLLNKPGVRPYVLMPFLLNVSLFVLIIWLGADQLNSATEWMVAQLPDWLDWLSWLVSFLFAIIIVLIVFFTFSLVANLIGAPFNGLLAEAVYKHLTGELPDVDNPVNFWKNFLPSIKNEIIKLRYTLIWTGVGLLLFVIPVINITAPVVWFVITAWLLALEYMDYPMANHEIPFSEQRDKLREQRWSTLSFGAGVSIATLTPFANFLVMPAAVAAATAMWVERMQPKLADAGTAGQES